MIVGTVALLARLDAAEPAHQAVSAAVESAASPLVTAPYVVAQPPPGADAPRQPR